MRKILATLAITTGLFAGVSLPAQAAPVGQVAIKSCYNANAGNQKTVVKFREYSNFVYVTEVAVDITNTSASSTYWTLKVGSNVYSGRADKRVYPNTRVYDTQYLENRFTSSGQRFSNTCVNAWSGRSF